MKPVVEKKLPLSYTARNGRGNYMARKIERGTNKTGEKMCMDSAGGKIWQIIISIA
jgi:hypothetical protein